MICQYFPLNASDSIHVLYGIHPGVSPVCCRRRLVGVGCPPAPLLSRQWLSPADEMTQYFDQGAMSCTLSGLANAHPFFTCVTCQHSGRIWEIGGVSTDPAHRRKRYTVSRSVPAVRRSPKHFRRYPCRGATENTTRCIQMSPGFHISEDSGSDAPARPVNLPLSNPPHSC